MSSPPAKVCTFNGFLGLHKHWEEEAQLRNRLRDYRRFILEAPLKGETEPGVPESSVCKTSSNLKFSRAVLQPLLAMCASAEGVPCVDTLYSEIEQFYKMHNLTHGFGVLRNDAWSVRYLFGVLKNYLWKTKPPRATCLTILGLKWSEQFRRRYPVSN